MPLVYAIDGNLTPYEAPSFASLLESKLGQGEIPRSKTLQGYAEIARLESERKPAMRAEQVMSAAVICISPKASLKKAEEVMKARGIRHLPVTDDAGKLIGILSDRDLLRATGAIDLPVSEYMSCQVLTATPETSIRQIAEALVQNKISALPVVDSGQRVVGILTTTDILKAIVMRGPLELWV